MKRIKALPLFSLCKILLCVFFLAMLSSKLWGFVYSDTQNSHSRPSPLSLSSPAQASGNMLTHFKQVLLPHSTSDTKRQPDSDHRVTTTKRSTLVQIAQTYSTSDRTKIVSLSPKKTPTSSPEIIKRLQILLISGILLTIGMIFLPTLFSLFHQQPKSFFYEQARSSTQMTASDPQYSEHRAHTEAAMTETMPRIRTPLYQETPHDKEIFLSTLSEEDCNAMIHSLGNRMGLHYTEESLSRIYYETGGHPYVSRQLCSLIAKNILASVSHTSQPQAEKDVSAPMLPVEVKDVEDAVSEYLEYTSDYLARIWHQLPQIEQNILKIIMAYESCTLDDLMQGADSLQGKRERRKAISTLIEHEIIEKCENKYSMRMGVFERYLFTIL